MQPVRKARRSLTIRFWLLQMVILLGAGVATANLYRWHERREVDLQLARQLTWLRDEATPPYTPEHLSEELAEIAVGADRGLGVTMVARGGGDALTYGFLDGLRLDRALWAAHSPMIAFTIDAPTGTRLRVMWTRLQMPQYDQALCAVTMAGIDASFRFLLLFLGMVGAGLATATAILSWRFSQAAYSPVVQAHEQMQQFLADSAHELRTPLAAIVGEADVALMRARTGDEYRETIALCRAHAREIDSAVSGILGLSRLQAGVGHGNRALVDLAALVQSELQHAVGATDGPTVSFEAAGDPLVIGDEHGLAAVVRNLLSNAIQHAVGTDEIRIRVQRGDGHVTLTVSDDGPGIHPNDVPHIFDRFYRGKSPDSGRTHHGAGLGLAIVAETVRAHGGTVSVDDWPGPGATFTVTLPAAGGS